MDVWVSRRWLLAGGVALVVGGGAGVGADFLSARPRSRPVSPPAPPAELLAAITAERALIADLDATTGGTPPVRQVIVQARADHAAHLRALRGALAGYAKHRTTPQSGAPRTRAELRRAEERAAAAAGRRAAALSGAHAALLASIAACEATHAALL